MALIISVDHKGHKWRYEDIDDENKYATAICEACNLIALYNIKQKNHSVYGPENEDWLMCQDRLLAIIIL